ncbi:hypothetical protein BpHYR1_028526 [Brachionus plicatilis]|uniref:Uncharacterized protein n=1 Tax=Brachionus plicatilis TaxID=10195 RepID=A0A3M7Q434_BRAPC|nr:hypothetical protein BpHYR1_028526 [Brachionus plicatilis]
MKKFSAQKTCLKQKGSQQIKKLLGTFFNIYQKLRLQQSLKLKIRLKKVIISEINLENTQNINQELQPRTFSVE